MNKFSSILHFFGNLPYRMTFFKVSSSSLFQAYREQNLKTSLRGGTTKQSQGLHDLVLINLFPSSDSYRMQGNTTKQSPNLDLLGNKKMTLKTNNSYVGKCAVGFGETVRNPSLFGWGSEGFLRDEKRIWRFALNFVSFVQAKEIKKIKLYKNIKRMTRILDTIFSKKQPSSLRDTTLFSSLRGGTTKQSHPVSSSSFGLVIERSRNCLLQMSIEKRMTKMFNTMLFSSLRGSMTKQSHPVSSSSFALVIERSRNCLLQMSIEKRMTRMFNTMLFSSLRGSMTKQSQTLNQLASPFLIPKTPGIYQLSLLVITCLTLLTSQTLKAQSAIKELRKVRDAYATNQQLAFDVSAYAYKTKTDKKPVLISSGNVKKLKENYYSSFLNYVLVVTANKALMIDKEEKNIDYYEYKIEKQQTPKEFQINIDSLMAGSDSVVMRATEAGLKHFTIFDNNDDILQTELYVDAKTNFITRILYYYAPPTEDFESEYDRVDVYYKNITTTGITPDFFSLDKYIKKNKNTYYGVGIYQTYKVNYYNSKS